MDGASWGYDGYVYVEGLTFGGDSTRGVLRVPETGGAAEVVFDGSSAGADVAGTALINYEGLEIVDDLLQKLIIF